MRQQLLTRAVAPLLAFASEKAELELETHHDHPNTIRIIWRSPHFRSYAVHEYNEAANYIQQTVTGDLTAEGAVDPDNIMEDYVTSEEKIHTNLLQGIPKHATETLYSAVPNDDRVRIFSKTPRRIRVVHTRRCEFNIDLPEWFFDPDRNREHYGLPKSPIAL